MERIRVIDLVSCIQVVAEEVEEQEVGRLGKRPDRNGYTAHIVEPEDSPVHKAIIHARV